MHQSSRDLERAIYTLCNKIGWEVMTRAPRTKRSMRSDEFTPFGIYYKRLYIGRHSRRDGQVIHCRGCDALTAITRSPYTPLQRDQLSSADELVI